MRRLLLCAATALCFATPAFAESRILEEIEVKGKKETRTETLEVREVRETHAHDLGEALEMSGNLCKVRKGGIANDVVIRGYQKDNINVLIDGARLQGACPNRMDPPAFHLDYAEVDRVEVKKGPYDVSHPGSMGGIVDVRTRSGRPGLHGELNVGYGSFQSFESSAVLSAGTPDLDLILGGAYKGSKPYESGDGKRITELSYPNPANRYRPEEAGTDAYRIATGWAKAGIRPSEGQRVELSLSRQEADDVIYPYLLMDAVYDDTDRVNLSWTAQEVGSLSRTLVRFYWNDVEHDMTDGRRCSSSVAPPLCGPKLAPGYGMRTFATSTVTGAKAEAAVGSSAETVFGADWYARYWDAVTTRVTDRAIPAYADSASLPDTKILDVGLYAEHRRRLSRPLRLTAGVRLDRATSRARIDRSAFYALFYPGVTSSDLSQTDTLPTGNVQLDFDATGALSFFLGYGHGARIPDPQERYFALEPLMTNKGAAGNPNLEPVTNDEFDAGVKYSTPRLLAKVQLFHSDLDDYIIVSEVVSPLDNSVTKTWRNVDARMYGGEASARLSLPGNLFASAGIAVTVGKNDTDRTYLAEIPPLRGFAALRYDVERWFGEVEWIAADRQDKVDTVNVQETPTPGWAVLNLKAGFSGKGFRLYAGVKNLFDRYYTEHLSYFRDPFSAGIKVPEPGRSLYANLQYEF